MCESNRKFLAEAEGRHIRQASSIDHYAIVKLRIYMIDTDAVFLRTTVQRNSCHKDLRLGWRKRYNIMPKSIIFQRFKSAC